MYIQALLIKGSVMEISSFFNLEINIPGIFRKLQYSTGIVKKNQFNSKQIIQILQPIKIDFLDAFVY